MTAAVKRIMEHNPHLAVLAEHASYVIYRQHVSRIPSPQYINPAVEQLLGYTPEELYSTPAVWAALTKESDQALVNRLISDKTRCHALVQTHWRHKDGYYVLVGQDLAIERTSTGKAIAIEAIVRPLVSRIIDGLVPSEWSDLPTPEPPKNISLSNWNSASDINDVLERILLEVGKAVPNDGATIMLIEDNHTRFVCQSGVQFDGHKQAEQPDQLTPLKKILFADQIMTAKQGVVIEDVAAQKDWLGVEGMEWLRGYLAAPIIMAGSVIGLITLVSKTAGVFRKEDIHRLEFFAEYAATAIQNVQRYETEHFERLLAEGLQESTEIMVRSASTDEAFANILRCLNELIKSEWSTIMLMRSDQLVTAASAGSIPAAVEVGATFDYSGIPLFLDSLNTAEPVIYSDVLRESDSGNLPDLGFEPRSWVGVPIVVWDVIVGYLAAASTAADVFSLRDARAAQAFSHQAALVIEHAEILSELEVSKLNLGLVRAQLLRTARLHMAGEIATGIAHKVNNPLTTVIAESYLLASSMPDDSPQQESIRAIRDAAFEAGTVVQRLMDTARFRPLVLRPTQVNDSIASAIAMIRGLIEPDIGRLVVDLATDLPLINGSTDHLRDLWLRLLLNARDALEHGTRGKITVRSVLETTDDRIHVTISDNGKGIAPEQLDEIFKPLHTTKEHATGLGLSICNEIVTNHHGVISVASDLQKGTSVNVSFSAALLIHSHKVDPA